MKTNRKLPIVIVGGGTPPPMGFHITPSIIHYHARNMGKNSLHLLMMHDLIMSGKTVMCCSIENGFKKMTEEKIKEKMRGLVITKMPSYSQVLKPYSSMKPLTVPYKERFRLQRLKQFNNK